MPTPDLDRLESPPDPDNPGWRSWNFPDPTRFNAVVMGHLLLRAEGERGARLRMMPDRHHSNLLDHVHGGITLALADIALFATMHVVLGIETAGAVTVDLSTQFIGGGRIGQPLDAVAEVLRETRRLVFLRGLVEQDGHLVAAFSGTVRKASTSR